MFRVFDYFFRKIKLLFTNQTWFSFGICLLIGFVVTVLLGQSFQRVSANPTIDLDHFDSDTNPALMYYIIRP